MMFGKDSDEIIYLPKGRRINVQIGTRAVGFEIVTNEEIDLLRSIVQAIAINEPTWTSDDIGYNQCAFCKLVPLGDHTYAHRQDCIYLQAKEYSRKRTESGTQETSSAPTLDETETNATTTAAINRDEPTDHDQPGRCDPPGHGSDQD